MQPIGAALQLEQVLPNPFSIAATVRYQLPRSGRVRIGIYEPCRRLVRMLRDRLEPAGTGSVKWDGQTDAGRVAAAGVYLYRLDFGGEQRFARIVRIQ